MIIGNCGGRTDMEFLEQEIAKIEESIDEYDEVDTLAMDSIDVITKAGYKQ